MQQGDCNAPTTMIRAMNWLLRELLGKTVMVYLDDILIGNHTYKEYIQTVRGVLKTLEKAKMWFNKDKCQIMPERIDLLEHVLHNNGLEADLEKIKKVVDFKTPTNKNEIQRFISIVNYLARFYKDLATKGRCLYELQGSTKQFKLVCTTAPVLGGHTLARSTKIGQKTGPLTYLGNFITQIGQTDLLEFFRTL